MNENSTLIAAAIGATVGVISAATIFIYNKIVERSRCSMTSHSIETMNQRISMLQAELESLRLQQCQSVKKVKRSKRRGSISNDITVKSNDTEIEYAHSIASTDVFDDEFYDCSDSESTIADNDTRVTDPRDGLAALLAEIDNESVEKAYAAEDLLEIQESCENTYKKLLKLTNSFPEDIEISWRFARSCYKYFNCLLDPKEKENILLEGIEVCDKVIYTQNADLHKWYAILLGLRGEFLPIAEKIKNGNRFKNHINIALAMRPQDSSLYHLLGRFQFEVAGLSWIQRKIAATIYTEPPEATYHDAINDFVLAEKYAKTPHLENRLFIGKCYIAIKQFDKAVEWLNRAIEIPVLSNEDKLSSQEANELLRKYSKKR